MSSKHKKIIIYSLYLFPALLAILVVFNKIFPTETYSFKLKELDQSNIILAEGNSFTIAPLQDPQKIKVALELETNFSEETANEIILRKGFAAIFYPQKKEKGLLEFELGKYAGKFYLITETEKKLIPTPNILQSYGGEAKAKPIAKNKFEKLPLSKELAGFLDGTLIKSQDSIFIISDGKKIVVPSPQIFDGLKYDWEKVVPAEEKEARIHSGSPAFLSLASPHPNGTILEDAASGNYYLVDNGELIGLSRELYEKNYSAIAPIKLASFNPKEEIRTTLDKNGRCFLELPATLKAEEGNAYNFQLPKKMSIKEIKIRFLRNISWENIKILLRKFR